MYPILMWKNTKHGYGQNLLDCLLSKDNLKSMTSWPKEMMWGILYTYRSCTQVFTFGSFAFDYIVTSNFQILESCEQGPNKILQFLFKQFSCSCSPLTILQFGFIPVFIFLPKTFTLHCISSHSLHSQLWRMQPLVIIGIQTNTCLCPKTTLQVCGIY